MTLNSIKKKKDGFEGQKAIIIPRKILLNLSKKNRLNEPLYITDIGYYPKAKFHYRERPHGADQQILIYCLEGQGNVTIDTKRYVLNSGEFVVIPAKTPHQYDSEEMNPWTIFWVHFRGEIAESVIQTIQKQLGGPKGFIRHNEKSIAIFNEIYSQLERGYGNNNLLFANMCFWHFLSTFMFNEKYDKSGNEEDKDPVDLAIDFISKKIDCNLTLEQIAQQVTISPSHFSFLFKQKTGFSPIEYFNHLKVQKACQFLLFTHLRIKEIAIELGIKDQYYFSRMFTKIMGMSPNSYREKRTQ